MKTLYILFLSLIAVQNCSNQMQDKFPVAITDAYYQRWVGGVQGGGSGTGLYFTIDKSLPSDVVLYQLYFRGQKDSIKKIDETNFFASFRGTANWVRGDETKTSDVTPIKIEIPVEIKEDEALIEYSQNKTKKYIKITNLVEKEMLAYPSARPRN